MPTGRDDRTTVRSREQGATSPAAYRRDRAGRGATSRITRQDCRLTLSLCGSLHLSSKPQRLEIIHALGDAPPESDRTELTRQQRRHRTGCGLIGRRSRRGTTVGPITPRQQPAPGAASPYRSRRPSPIAPPQHRVTGSPRGCRPSSVPRRSARWTSSSHKALAASPSVPPSRRCRPTTTSHARSAGHSVAPSNQLSPIAPQMTASACAHRATPTWWRAPTWNCCMHTPLCEVSAIRMFDVSICIISGGPGQRFSRTGCDGATHNNEFRQGFASKR